MELTAKIAMLERDLRGLIRKWERYFGGDLKVPPVKERESFYRRLRLVVDEPGQLRAAERFRLDQLQARYGTYSSNWERMLREREEGIRRWTPAQARIVEDDTAAPAPPAPTSGQRGTTESAGPRPTDDVPARESVRLPNDTPATPVDRPGAEDLFGRWSAAKQSLGQEVRLDRLAFDAQVAAQREAAEAKLGSSVHFDVAIVDGKVKLTARRAASPDIEE
jgi:hypothetical protein